MRQRLPSYIVSVTGIILVAERFLQITWLSALASELKNWGVILGAASIVLGIANLVVVNLHSLRSRRTDMISTGMLFVALAAVGVIGMAKGTGSPLYQKIYTNTYVPMATTVFSMKIFYMLSAAYRSFVAKRAEALVMLLVSMVTLVTVVSVGESILPAAPKILDWLQTVPNVAGQRGILIGAALGSFATALRTLIGYERTNVGM